MKYQYILFDLDGTLTDPKEGITKSVAYALKSFGIQVDNLDSLCKFIGPPLKDSFIDYYGFSEEDAILAISKYREYFADKGIFENFVYQGIDTLLESLKNSGKSIILATSKPTIFADRILEHFNLKKYFDFIAGSELNLCRQTKTEVIQYALEEANITDISHAIMIGDREHDIIGAKNNKLTSLGVLYGYGNKEELTNAGADYIVKTVSELSNFLIFGK